MYTPRSEAGELNRQLGYNESMKARAYETYLKRMATLEARHVSLKARLAIAETAETT